MIRNSHNWRALPRAFVVIGNPISFLVGLLRRRAPPQLSVRTPTGTVVLTLRNFESLKTLFSIFCREDYFVAPEEAGLFIDVGANIGLAGAYFLSRNNENRVVCFEPDSGNLDCLRANLAPFAARATIEDCAIAPCGGATVLYRSADGKHSSLLASERAQAAQPIATRSFDAVLCEAAKREAPTVVKLDVEGMEEELVKSVSFDEHLHVRRLLCERRGIGAFVSRPHRLIRRNAYIDDLIFDG